MKLGVVFALASDNGIGLNGSMPWHIPQDLNLFRGITMGQPMIMGRRTWESFNERILPGRIHIVVSRDPDFKLPKNPLLHLADSFEHAKLIARAHVTPQHNYTAWVIGGAKLIEAALLEASVVSISHIRMATYDGPTDVQIKRSYLNRIYMNRLEVQHTDYPDFVHCMYKMA